MGCIGQRGTGSFCFNAVQLGGDACLFYGGGTRFFSRCPELEHEAVSAQAWRRGKNQCVPAAAFEVYKNTYM